MSRQTDSWPNGLEKLVELAEERLETHPEPRELVAYRQGELTPNAESRLQEHLALCRDCTALYLDLEEMMSSRGEVADAARRTAPELDWRVAWPAMAQRLRKEESVESTGSSSPPKDARVTFVRFLGSPRAAYGLAALFFVVASALFAWNVVLQQTIREQISPRVNIPIQDLQSRSKVRTPSGSAETVELQGEESILVLNPREAPSQKAFRVLIRDSRGRALWRSSELRPTEFGNFTLKLPRRFLPSGHYVIELHGLDPGQETLLGTFDLDLGEP